MKSRAAPEGCLIVGYGCPLRGDDRVGLAAAHILARRGYRALAVHQLSPELAEPVAGARTVVFLDADARLAPGEVAVERLWPDPVRSGPMEHHSTPQALLALARQLYASEPDAWRIGIGGEDFGFGRRLSPSARSGLRRAIAEVAGAGGSE